jgi:hypothetical protein
MIGIPFRDDPNRFRQNVVYRRNNGNLYISDDAASKTVMPVDANAIAELAAEWRAATSLETRARFLKLFRAHFLDAPHRGTFLDVVAPLGDDDAKFTLDELLTVCGAGTDECAVGIDVELLRELHAVFSTVPDSSHPTTLAEFNYKFDAAGRLSNLETGSPFHFVSQVH